ncbi:arylsulfatase [Rhodopirellula sp. P2]|nr:arylsulfatase [Rhodopirellula sp. P2]WDQ15976.1 arylsulfatase [Rhodopirellula sp. P2]
MSRCYIAAQRNWRRANGMCFGMVEDGMGVVNRLRSLGNHWACVVRMACPLAILACILLPGAGFSAEPNGDLQPPHIVHIIADDLGWNDVGYHGSDIRTPNIDRLASESVTLDRFYVTPICSPTRAGVLTGLYPFRFGIWGGVVSPTKKHGLPTQLETTPEHLSKLGYQHRAMFGKWHLGLASTLFHPLRHGMTEFYGHYNGAIDYFSRERFCQLDWHRDFDSVHEEGYSTELVGNAVVDFIDRHAGEQPLYAYVAFNAPHSPLQALRTDLDEYGFDPTGKLAPNTDRKIAKREKSLEYGERGKGNSIRQTFAAMTTAMDRQIGRILDAIDRNGMRENTLVVFHSDNGADPKHGGSNEPLRGNKFTTWEGGVRVVAMIRWPREFPAGATLDSVASHVDLLPTMVAAAGGPPPERTDGLNLLPFLSGKASPPQRTILLDAETVVSDRWKLKAGELFDLTNDPYETTPVEPARKNVRRRLDQALQRYPSLVGPAVESQLPAPEIWPPREWKLPEEEPIAR